MAEILIVWSLGVAAGSIITCMIHTFKTAFGTLHIDHSDPGKDVHLLAINNLDDIEKKKYIQLRINHKADLSQK